MLPTSLRLSRKGFEENGDLSRAITPHFHISYKESSESGGSAVIVSKKNVKGAVGRHLLKRRVKAALRPWSRPSRILIVSARKGAESITYTDIENELSSALSGILAK